MIIFLYGPDDYRREQKNWEILAEFQRKQSDLGIGKFDLANGGDFEKFQEFLRSQSLFQVAKMAILDSAFEAEAKDLGKTLKDFLENKDVTILMSEKDKPVKTLDFLRRKPVVFQEFEILKGKEWESFVVSEIQKREIKISSSGVKFLTQVYEGDTWRFITELDKIQHLGNPSTSSGPRMEIHTRDLEDLGIEQAPNFWSLIWGFKNRDIKERLWALERVFGMNEPAAKMFNILAYQLPDKKTAIAYGDLAVKSGKLEYEEALLELIISQ